MEYYKSTLATTAVAVFGLLAAAHVLHPGNYEVQPRPARPVAAASVAAVSWADPPARLRGEPAPAVPEQVVELIPAPRTMTALAPDIAAQPPRSTAAARPDRPRKAAAAERRKLAQRAARGRQAALGGGTPVEPAAARPDARETRPAGRIDPIGDLLRGLGLGRES